jgi:hypothetical protein
MKHLLGREGVTKNVQRFAIVELLHRGLKPVGDPGPGQNMAQLCRDPRNHSDPVFLLGLGSGRFAWGNPALVGPLADPQEISLAALRNVKLFVKPGENILDRPVFSHRLALCQSGKQKADLLEPDAHRPALFAIVIKCGGSLRTKGSGLDLNPQRRVDQRDRSVVGLTDRVAQIADQLED